MSLAIIQIHPYRAEIRPGLHVLFVRVVDDIGQAHLSESQ